MYLEHRNGQLTKIDLTEEDKNIKFKRRKLKYMKSCTKKPGLHIKGYQELWKDIREEWDDLYISPSYNSLPLDKFIKIRQWRM